MNKEINTYIITGMGRSGTSFLSKALIDQGVYMGKEMYDDTYENLDFVNINKNIYTDLHKGWGIGGNPPDTDEVMKLNKKYGIIIDKTIQKNKKEFWGFKEPRLSSTFPLFMPKIFEIDDDPFIYIALRKPKYIAKSLQKRIGNNYKYEQGIKTARAYHKNIKKLINYITKYE